MSPVRGAAAARRRAAGVVIVSNGHGEDVIGAALAEAMLTLAPDLVVRAFPLVDAGEPYAALGLDRLGPCRVMPSGGFTMHARRLFLADVRAGFVGMTARQVAAMAHVRSDVLLVVGDVYAQILASFAHAGLRAVLQPLVSARHFVDAGRPTLNRYFMERISYPERALMRRLASVVYVRDAITAEWLQAHGVAHAAALGNPMVDRAAGRPLEGLPAGPVVALLPGTRGQKGEALTRMAAALSCVPGATGVVAWPGGPVPRLEGWLEAAAPPAAGVARALGRQGRTLWFVEGRFAAVLASAQVAVGTAGTANEQAAARGVPVVSFPVEPHYTKAYLANQRRLLGPALTVTDGSVAALAAAVRRLLDDPALRSRCGRAGVERMGPPGGSARIARDLLQRAGLSPGSGDAFAASSDRGGAGPLA